MKKYFGLIKESFGRWSEDKVPRLGAALSYYTAFSIAPLLLLTISIVGFVLGDDAARGEVVGQLSGIMGRQSATTVQNMIQSANKPAAGTISTVIGILS